MNPAPARAERRASGVEALVHDFFMSLDTGDFEALAACMAPEGDWHRQGKILRGRDMILAAMAERGRDVRTAHVVTNFRVEAESADAARARFYLVAYRFDGVVREDEPSPMDLPVSIALYRCDCVGTDRGWAIANLQSRPWFRRSS